ncbi:MAG: HAD hydrolase-like protein, partial [Rhodospirillaceae bacterium]|nr:HAD hydrolase-like protein [Rhodospirillaceae bacterium]
MSPSFDLSPPRAMLFDWDNTLVDNWMAIVAALNAAQTSLGFTPWSSQVADQRLGQSLDDAFPAIFGERWQQARELFFDHFNKHHLDELRPMEGAKDLLDIVLAKEIFLAVVSNKIGPLLRREADHLGWQDYFTRLVGASDAGADKPSPLIVEQALSQSGVACGPDVWFVGDRPIDLVCAR